MDDFAQLLPFLFFSLKKHASVMGIPKFFRFISERWPLIVQPLQDPPVFDALYLDMNSILHNCAHPGDGLSHLSDDEIFAAVFAYIDHLFTLVQPQRVFYMAIDGVAPRAKMNQQRARRFRSAVEAEEAVAKAEAQGQAMPKEPFDNNAITPGTEFMAKVTENLKFFINQKVSTDSNWQNIEVILSGHEVPGEGEHKIMEYIRTQKAQPGYDVNTRHCVYGLDADLIMLGLVAHEPHFSILREEVTFGRQSKKATSDLSQQNFQLLHISLVRDYLQEEFKSLSDEITFEYNFESVLDDFILIMFVIGNDFLPNLPDLHLKEGAFPLLIETFKETMRRTDGYLNEKGEINLQRLTIWLEMLSHFELENFEQGAVDIEWFNQQLDNVSRKGEQKRSRIGKELILKQQKGMVSKLSQWLLSIYRSKTTIKDMYSNDELIPTIQLNEEFFQNDSNMDFIKQFGFDVGVLIIHSKSQNTWSAKLDIDGIDPNESQDQFDERFNDLKNCLRKWQNSIVVNDSETLAMEKNLYDEKFIQWKDKYYKTKLHFSIHDEDKLKAIAENYLEGLQWVLHYYYTGICSWPWYYQYHYAPRISDVIKGIDVKINFEMGKPFLPFEQLMSVLPARSRKLLPSVYHSLMTDPQSNIIDFYPDDCDIDMNGKKNSWEAVVLLSFVDPERLFKAMKEPNTKLSSEETKRNTFGTDLIYHYNPQVSKVIKSPIPLAFPDFDSHTMESIYKLPSMENKKFIIGLSEGVQTGGELIAGFPTLHTMTFNSNLEQARLTVFQQPSRSHSMILSLANKYEGLSVQEFTQEFAQSPIWCNWPYLVEYKVEYVIDNLMRYEIKNGKLVYTALEHYELEDFKSLSKDWTYKMKTKMGLRFEGSKEEDVEIIEELEDRSSSRGKKSQDSYSIPGFVFAKKVIGLAPNKQGHFKKFYSEEIEAFPIQLVCNHLKNIDERFQEKDLEPIDVQFPIDSEMIFLGSMSYGGKAVVVDHFDDQNVIVDLERIDFDLEPQFGKDASLREKSAFKYHSSKDCARILNVHPRFFSKFTSRLLVTNAKGDRKNVGLNLKSVKNGTKTLGYSRTNGTYWEFSDMTIAYFNEYKSKFPKVVKALIQNTSNDIPNFQSLLGLNEKDSESLLKELTTWLREKEDSLVFVSLNSDSLSRPSISAVENQIIAHTLTSKPYASRKMKCPRMALMNPQKGYLHLSKQKFSLGDRVMYAIDNGKVPCFAKGTVIGFRSFETNVSVQVIFDYPLLSGNTFDGRLTTQRGVSVDSSLLLNLSNKQMVVKSNKKAETSKTKKQQPKQKPVEPKQIQSKTVAEEAGATKHASATEQTPAASAPKKNKPKKKILKNDKKKDQVVSDAPISTPAPAASPVQTTKAAATEQSTAGKLMDMLKGGKKSSGSIKSNKNSGESSKTLLNMLTK